MDGSGAILPEIRLRGRRSPWLTTPPFRLNPTWHRRPCRTAAVTRRSLLGGAGIAVGAAVLASPPSMPGIAPAAAQPASADPRPLDAAFKRRAFEVRGVCAGNNEKIPIAPHPTNGDEARYTNKIGSDSRGLPHDKRGEVEQAAWQALYAACQSGDPADFEKIPLGGTRKLVNPVGTLAVSLSGINPTQIGIPPAPALASAERGGEAVEVYWQSLLRDVPLTELRDDTSNRDVLAATEELNKLADFRGPKSGGRVTPGTLFRANALYFDPADPNGRSVTPPGVLDGPLISQFLLRDVPYAAQWISAQIRTVVARQRIPDRIRGVAGDPERRRTETPAAVRRDTAIHNDRKRSRGVYPHWSCAWVGGSTDPCNPRRWSGPTLLRDLSTGRARVLPIEPVSEIENPGTCGCHLRVGVCAGTTRHGDQ